MPTFKEMLAAKKDQVFHPTVKAIEKPLEKPRTSRVPKPKKEKAEVIPGTRVMRFEPTSDHMRTAYFLLTGRSSRGTIAEIKQQLRIILDQMEAKQEAKLKDLTQ